MVRHLLTTMTVRLLLLLLLSIAETDAISTSLIGTWTSKSGSVLTGPQFYNPINDSFTEPSHTGISYSFSSSGHYESAYYRAIANPTTPSCPGAILQFQHGTFVETSAGELVLTPFAVDGRQLLSQPCVSKTATYTRYSQGETMKRYTVRRDEYTGAQRLDLYAFDGRPLNPLFLAYRPPMMLPTVMLNPTSTATPKGVWA